MTLATLATRSFSGDDQEAFAQWSGDRNAVHMDEAFASRTQAGARLIHGVHGVLWALEQLSPDDLVRARALKVQFKRFVHLDRNVTVKLVRRDERQLKLAIDCEGAEATAITLAFGGPPSAGEVRLDHLPAWPIDLAPCCPAFEQLGQMQGWLSPPNPAAKLKGGFPKLSEALGEDRLAAMALLSTLVGMACPGERSIFVGFAIDLLSGDPGRPGLGWRVQEADERFRLVTILVAGSGLSGTVSALAPSEPVEAPRYADVAMLVRPGEFARRNALVIGATRGLGAATAMLLAAGGAQVTLTYATSSEAAQSIADQIGSGPSASEPNVLRFDVRAEVADQLSALPLGLTDLYYFATPRIFRQSAGLYSAELHQEFTEIYVDRFAAVAQWLLSQHEDTLRRLLYPSSVAVAERPLGMTEYAMAKAAGEILCADLALALPRLKIAVPRLPRVLTRQTDVTPPVDAADAVATMLPILRGMDPGG